MKSRDTERSRVYKAENTVFGTFGTHGDKTSVDLPEVEDCQRFIDSVMQGDHWQRVGGFKIIRVHNGAGNSRCAAWHRRGGSHTIKLPIHTRMRWIVLHELAHALRDATGRANGPPHGPLFRAHYVELVREQFGYTQALRLANSFTMSRLLITRLEDIKCKRR